MPILVNLPGLCAAFVRGLNFVETAADAGANQPPPSLANRAPHSSPSPPRRAARAAKPSEDVIAGETPFRP